MSDQPIKCGGCGATWGGTSTCHCSGCHITLTGLSAFDKHRDGSHATGKRYCKTPKQAGLVDAGRKYPCFGEPGDGKEWWNGK